MYHNYGGKQKTTLVQVLEDDKTKLANTAGPVYTRVLMALSESCGSTRNIIVNNANVNAIYAFRGKQMRPTNKTVVEDPIVNRIIDEMNRNGINQKELIDYLGLGSGAFTRWKYNGMKSYMKYIDHIAEYLGVSKSYLLTGSDEPDSFELTTKEKEVISLYRKMPKSDQNCVYKLIKGYVSLEAD